MSRVLERDLIERPITGGKQREQEAGHAAEQTDGPPQREKAERQKYLEQVDELVLFQDHAKCEGGIAKHGLHDAAKALASLGHEPGVLMDERFLAAALDGHDDQLH